MDVNRTNTLSALQTPNGPAVIELAGQRYLLVSVGPTELKEVSDAPISQEPVSGSDDSLTNEPAKRTFVYGLKGLAELFGCSKATAYNIKRSGKIDAAISQIGNTIAVDAELALELTKIKK